MATGTAVDVVMPQMGVSVSEGTVTKWLKQVGDTIEADETLLEISTDKVDTEVPSPGVRASSARSSSRRARRSTSARCSRGSAARARQPRAPAAEPRPRREPADAGRGSTQPKPAAAEAAAPTSAPAAAGCAVARTASRSSRRSSRGSRPSTGSTRRQVPGTGRGGRVTKKDILAFIEAGAPASLTAAPAPPQPRCAPARSRTCADRPQRSQPGAAGSLAPARSLEPMTAMRRGIAEHMRRSLDTVGARHERDRGRHVEGGRDPREAEEGVPVRLRRQPDLPRLHRARDGRDAPRLPVGERRDPRRPDRHAELRQPRLRGRARRRQGPDRPGREERRDAQPARHGEGRSPTSRRARATSS